MEAFSILSQNQIVFKNTVRKRSNLFSYVLTQYTSASTFPCRPKVAVSRPRTWTGCWRPIRTKAIITADVGIASHAVVEYARNKWLKVFATDHHRSLSVLPAADVVVNPLREDDSYETVCHLIQTNVN